MHLTLLVPELIWPEPEDAATFDQLPCSALQTLLARGRLQRGPAQPFESVLAALCDTPMPAPFGALRLAGEAADAALASDGEWLCADPVHLRFHHEQIILADPGSFELGAEESRQLAADLSRDFADVGEFIAVHPRRWYLRLAEPLAVATEPLSSVAGRRLTTQRSGDGNDRKLRQLLSEIQIWLHNHPLNQARESAGQPTVNSLWLWGSGPLPQLASAPARIAGDMPLARGLAAAAGSAATPLPQGLAELPRHAGQQLVVLDQLLEPTLYERGDEWRAALARLEADWFAPALAGLGQFAGLAIVAPTIYGTLRWQVPPDARWRFWQRPQPLVQLARKLAA